MSAQNNARMKSLTGHAISAAGFFWAEQRARYGDAIPTATDAASVRARNYQARRAWKHLTPAPGL